MRELGPQTTRNGCSAMIAVVEAIEGRSEIVQTVSGRSTGGRAGRKKREARTPAAANPAVSRTLAALGHPTRLRILGKLLEGPATYRALQRLTRLKAGPLYHHINQLRLTGLILPKQRDLYELTRGGRNAVLVASALGSLARDRRRRPTA